MNAMYTQWVEIISKVAFLFLQLQKSKEYFYSCQLTRKVTSLFVRNSTFFGFVYIPPWGCFARKKCWISNKSWCHFWIELNSWKKTCMHQCFDEKYLKSIWYGIKIEDTYRVVRQWWIVQKPPLRFPEDSGQSIIDGPHGMCLQF